MSGYRANKRLVYTEKTDYQRINFSRRYASTTRSRIRFRFYGKKKLKKKNVRIRFLTVFRTEQKFHFARIMFYNIRDNDNNVREIELSV